jgi:hypothetical protein
MEIIIHIAKSIESDGPPPKKTGGVLQQNCLSQNMYRSKKCKKFGTSYQHKGQVKHIASNKGGIQSEKPPNSKTREVGFVDLM